MLKNYLSIALRQLWKHKLFSTFNLFGLATSMSVGLLVIMLLADQYAYDTFHEKKDRIFRVTSAKSEKNLPLGEPKYATSALSLAEELTDNYAWIEASTRILPVGSSMKVGDKIFETGGKGYAVDPSFLNIFSFGWTTGDRASALNAPYSLLLTRSAAERMFPRRDPVGAVIELPGLGKFTVTGLLPDPPVRSHIRFDFLMSFSTITSMTVEERANISVYSFEDIWRGLVYVLLAPDAGAPQLDQALESLAMVHSERAPDHHFLFRAQALSDVMPSRELSNEIGVGTPRIVLYFLMALGLIIILSACFNYTSLSVARSLQRAREIGVRKVIGARRKDIVLQFLSEGIFLALLSLGIALGLLEFLIPAFNSLDPFVSEVFTLEKTPFLLLLFLAFGILMGLLASVLPALNIAGVPPLRAIRQFTEVRILRRIGLRKGLITAQFALSLVFILTVIIVLRQQAHVLQTDLGTRTEDLFNVRMQTVDYDLFAQRVAQIKGVEEISASSQVILTGENTVATAIFGDKQDSLRLFYNQVSENYRKNLDIELVAGDDFPARTGSTGEPFIILNETAVRRMGFQTPAGALGQSITLDTSQLTVVGVARDFHHDNIWFAPIQPFGLIPAGQAAARNANITLNGTDAAETLAAIRTTWNDLSPDQPMLAFFTDERVYYLTKFFRMGSRIVGFIGILTIIIACMGLLGMVIYNVEGRIKEVGIRKVLGAGEGNIVWELSKGFFLLLGISIVIAVPLTLFVASLWLQNFLIRIDVGPVILLSGVGIMLVLGLLTVISQTLRAARNNPVEALRTE